MLVFSQTHTSRHLCAVASPTARRTAWAGASALCPPRWTAIQGKALPPTPCPGALGRGSAGRHARAPRALSRSSRGGPEVRVQAAGRVRGGGRAPGSGGTPGRRRPRCNRCRRCRRPCRWAGRRRCRPCRWAGRRRCRPCRWAHGLSPGPSSHFSTSPAQQNAHYARCCGLLCPVLRNLLRLWRGQRSPRAHAGSSALVRTGQRSPVRTRAHTPAWQRNEHPPRGCERDARGSLLCAARPSISAAARPREKPPRARSLRPPHQPPLRDRAQLRPVGRTEALGVLVHLRISFAPGGSEARSPTKARPSRRTNRKGT